MCIEIIDSLTSCAKSFSPIKLKLGFFSFLGALLRRGRTTQAITSQATHTYRIPTQAITTQATTTQATEFRIVNFIIQATFTNYLIKYTVTYIVRF